MFQVRLITVTSEVQQTDVLRCSRCGCGVHCSKVEASMLNRLTLEDSLGWWRCWRVECNPVSLCNPNQSVCPVGKWQEVQSEIRDGEKRSSGLCFEVCFCSFSFLCQCVSGLVRRVDAPASVGLLLDRAVLPEFVWGKEKKMACCYSVCRRIELAHISPPKSWCEMSWCQWVHPDPLQQPQKTLQSVNSKQACSSSVCGPSIQSAGTAVSNFCLWVGRRWN